MHSLHELMNISYHMCGENFLLLNLMKESLLMLPGNRAHRFFATILPAKEKTRSDVTDEGRQDKYDSAIACKCGPFVFVPIPMFFQLFEISLAIRETDWHRFSVKRSF